MAARLTTFSKLLITLLIVGGIFAVILLITGTDIKGLLNPSSDPGSKEVKKTRKKKRRYRY